MNHSELQVENGNFTRIINPLIEELVKIPFRGCELAVALFIIRKTYGYNKTQDEIPLSQFTSGLDRSKQTIVTALKNLELVNVARLVKKGSMKGDGNIWAINKYVDTWKLVKTARLVKRKHGASPYGSQKLVKTARQSKDTTKDISKDISKTLVLQGDQWNLLIDEFKEINPMYQKFYSNKTERSALNDMAKSWGFEKLLNTIKQLPSIIGQPYAPRITKPSELMRDIGKLLAFYKQEKSKNKSNYVL